LAYKFTEKYIDQIFYVWYQNDRPGIIKLHSIMPEEEGRKPSVTTLKDWYKDFGWEQRGDALDGEASRSLDQQVIQKRVEMWEKLEVVGGKLVDKGEEYLNNHELSTDMSAIRAITDGANLLRASVGQAEAWFKISQMTPAQLDGAFRALLNKGQNDVDVVDAENSDTESTPEQENDEPI
jgi:hypothetical protein